MLLRFDPFRELDRVADQAWTRSTSPAVAMDAVRRGDTVSIAFDLPGVDPDSIDLEVERNVLALTAERSMDRQEGDEVLAQERRQGRFSRQVLLGDTLDTSQIAASFDHGVLTVTIPVAEKAKPRRVEIGGSADNGQAIEAEVTSS